MKERRGLGAGGEKVVWIDVCYSRPDWHISSLFTYELNSDVNVI